MAAAAMKKIYWPPFSLTLQGFLSSHSIGCL
jgi:hypothetical protein